MLSQDSLRLPEAVNFEGNVAENWRIFEQAFRIYAKAALKKKDKDEIAYTMLNLAGREAIERSKTFSYLPETRTDDGGGRFTVTREAESPEDVEVLMKKFREICDPQSNVIVERHKFNMRRQQSNESVENYIADLKRLADKCSYGDLKDELIRDRLVCGVQRESVQRQMLKEADLTLRRAIQLCQIDEITHRRQQEMTSKVDAISIDRQTSRRPCFKCGKSHKYGKCPHMAQLVPNATGKTTGLPCVKHRAAVILAQEAHKVLATPSLNGNAVADQRKSMKLMSMKKVMRVKKYSPSTT